jgi:hypothetical protein
VLLAVGTGAVVIQGEPRASDASSGVAARDVTIMVGGELIGSSDPASSSGWS